MVLPMKEVTGHHFNDITSVLDFLVKVIEDAGFEPYRQVSLSLDIAANNFKFNKKYKMSNKKNILFSSNDLYDYLLKANKILSYYFY